MKKHSCDHDGGADRSEQIRRVALACFIEEVDPADLAYEDRFVIEMRREIENLRGVSGVESYLVCLTELSAIVKSAGGV